MGVVGAGELGIGMSDASVRILRWVQRLQAIAQNGLTFARDPYDLERYAAVRELAGEMLAASTDLSWPVVERIVGEDTGYATPKVDVRGVVFRGEELLLVREKSDGLWTLPGGWADVGASPAENAVREVEEESGYRTRAVKLLAVFDREKHPHQPPFPYHVYKLFIRCEVVGGEAGGSDETTEVGFFAEGQLPPLSVNRVTSGQLGLMFEHRRDGDRPTDFDRE